jgi:hypothetical protein
LIELTDNEEQVFEYLRTRFIPSLADDPSNTYAWMLLQTGASNVPIYRVTAVSVPDGDGFRWRVNAEVTNQKLPHTGDGRSIAEACARCFGLELDDLLLAAESVLVLVNLTVRLGSTLDRKGPGPFEVMKQMLHKTWVPPVPTDGTPADVDELGAQLERMKLT